MVMVRKASRNVGKYTLTHKVKPHRRTPRPARTIMTRSQYNATSSSSSLLHRLPSEVFDMILDQLSVLEISVFSMVSKEISTYVVDYISMLSWKNKMILRSFHHSTCLEQRSTIAHYRELGLLFKRCTLLLPTKERLKLIFNTFLLIPCFMLEQCLVPDCIGFSCHGVFLQTLIAGWDDLECHRVFNFLCDLTNLLQKIEAVITAKPGIRWYQELQLRLFCRQVLLDPWLNQPDSQFWLMQLLKPWPIVSQAHLLFILYGPMLPEGTLGWQDLVERGLPHSALWDLARAILLLFGKLEVKGWTTDSMLAILEELTVIPQPWHVENVARLLVLCGSSLCYTVLASKALNGRLLEVSRLIVYMILVCEKDGYHMSWAVKLVLEICKVFSTAPEKFCFIQQLENMFSEITREFFEFSVTGNHVEDRETFQNLCILLDSSARFHTKFLHMFLK
ncbi:F-box only protein 47 [Anabas testudineus]|uniref:F-box domain-containing protein n=1 Tax=Anabas testudineus TaxID=64144 RepID=A0A3Q1HBD5_ANATE|nr:F-box only protein 47 [Anabas testudineus]